MRYASINLHQYKAGVFRDDLESLGYTVLSLMVQNNEFWFRSRPTEATHKELIQEKTAFIEGKIDNHRFEGI